MINLKQKDKNFNKQYNNNSINLKYWKKNKNNLMNYIKNIKNKIKQNY